MKCLKIKQTYVCGEDTITIRFTTNDIGLIVNLEEVSRTDELPNEVVMPKLHVTDEQFTYIINNKKLR